MARLEANSTFGNYQIVRSIGGGGMAQIYLAKTTGLAGFEKLLALKVINPEYASETRFIQMLIDEAKISVELSHVNIAQVFDLGQVDGIYYIAMEYVEGCDILELVNSLHTLGRRMPIEATLLVTAQMCAGLYYAHKRKGPGGNHLKIIHRDVSPQNIIISRAGEVKIVDFGIAKAASSNNRTQAGVIKGKVNYMAPEQAMGKPIDHRIDIFSAGIVLWEMLTSQMAYKASGVGELLATVRQADIDPPSSVRQSIPLELDRIVLKALAADLDTRYQTARDFQMSLMKYLSTTAPEYGSAQLAELVEEAIAVKQRSVPQEENLEGKSIKLSKEDSLADSHSLIYDMRIESYAGSIHWTDANGAQQKATLKDESTIGRAAEVLVNDTRASRKHAKITKKGGLSFFVEDLESSNGTFVNGHRILQKTRLSDGDTVRIGNTTLHFKQSLDVPKTAANTILTVSGNQGEHAIKVDSPTSLHYRMSIGALTIKGRLGILEKEGQSNELRLRPVNERIPLFVDGNKLAANGQKLTDTHILEVSGTKIDLKK